MSLDYHVYYGPAIVCSRVKRQQSIGMWGCSRCGITVPGDWKHCTRCGDALKTTFSTENDYAHPDDWVAADTFRVIPRGDTDHYHDQDVLITNLRADPWGIPVDPVCDDVRIDTSHINTDGLLREFEKHYAKELAILKEKTGEAYVTWGLFVWSS